MLEVFVRRFPLFFAASFAALTACANEPTATSDYSSDWSDGGYGDNRDGGDRDGWDRDRDDDGDRSGNDDIYGVDDRNNLVRFDADDPENARSRPITGVVGTVIGIDFRPNDQNPADNIDNAGQLYAVSNSGGLYTIDLRTAVATFRSQMNVTPAGAFFGVGFNPMVDRLRIHSDQEQNLRSNVDNGLTLVDAPLAYAAGDRNFGRNPDVVGTAYTNSVNPPPSSTELYAIDARQDVLVELPSPNNGQLVTVGRLGTNTNSYVGFDIPGGRDRNGFASLTRDGASSSSLYTVDLDDGEARFIGRIGHVRPLVGIAVNDRSRSDWWNDRN